MLSIQAVRGLPRLCAPAIVLHYLFLQATPVEANENFYG